MSALSQDRRFLFVALNGPAPFDYAILTELVPAMAIAGMTLRFQFLPRGFALMSAGQLSAGTGLDVKCLFAIDAIAAAYRANPARWGK